VDAIEVVIHTVTGMDSPLSLRELVQLVLLGVLAVLLMQRTFADNPSSRRVLLMGVTVVLLGLPITWMGQPLQIPVPLGLATIAEGDVMVPALLFLMLVVPGVLRSGALIAGAFRRQYGLKRSGISADPHLQSAVDAALEELGFHARVRLVIGGVEGPASGTLFGPVLLFPRNAGEWSGSTLRAVLAHECVHLARRDDLWVLLIRIVTAFYWWMPWLKPLESRLLEAIEESCDDAAGVLRGDVCYLEGMVDVARRSVLDPDSNQHHAGLIGMAWLRDSHLLERVRRFSGVRILEIDSRGVYWSLLALVVVSIVVAGVQPLPAVATPSAAEKLLHAASTLHMSERSNDSTLGVEISVEALHTSPQLTPRLLDTLAMVVPRYPADALTNSISGEVRVEFELAADGSVLAPRVVSAPHSALERAALAAAAQSRFAALHTVPVLRLEPPQFRAAPGSAPKALLIYRFILEAEHRQEHRISPLDNRQENDHDL